LLLLAPLALLMLALALRYYLVWRMFRIPEHLMMMGGAIVSSIGTLVYSQDLIGFFLGIGLIAWGLSMWVDGHLNLTGNLKWREIRRGNTRRDVWLLRFKGKNTNYPPRQP